jgi:hypothetical protein
MSDEVIPDPAEPVPAGPFPDPLPGTEPDEPTDDEQQERLPDDQPEEDEVG